jgi:hypothetical protein
MPLPRWLQNDERLANEVGAGRELSRLCRSNKVGNDEAVDHARQ